MSVSFNEQSYGASRRTLGICYVGSIVLIAVLVLSMKLPEQLCSTSDPSHWHWFRNISLFALAYEVFSIPFDLVGFSIEKKFHPRVESLFQYCWKLSRAAFKHGLLFVSTAFFLAYAAEHGGIAALLAVSLVLCLTFTWKQGEIAGFLSNLRFSEPDQKLLHNCQSLGINNVLVGCSADEGFTGGVVGLPKQESVIIPEKWTAELSEQELQAELTRRKAAIESGSRTRGVVAANVFVLIGVIVSGMLTQSLFHLQLYCSAGIMNMSLLFTLWSFLGLLFLPVWNQKGVVEVDKLALAKGISRNLLAETVRKIDANMENEATRSDRVQYVFHPIPTPGRRFACWNSGVVSGAWHVARYSVWLSLAGLGLLGRAVHCNAGRPDLWCMLPAD